jgi:hypothetical protein
VLVGKEVGKVLVGKEVGKVLVGKVLVDDGKLVCKKYDLNL